MLSFSTEKRKSLTAILLLLSLLNEKSTAGALKYMIGDYVDNFSPWKKLTLSTNHWVYNCSVHKCYTHYEIF